MSIARRPATVTMDDVAVSDARRTPRLLAMTGGSRNDSVCAVRSARNAAVALQAAIAAAHVRNADRLIPPTGRNIRFLPRPGRTTAQCRERQRTTTIDLSSHGNVPAQYRRAGEVPRRRQRRSAGAIFIGATHDGHWLHWSRRDGLAHRRESRARRL